MEKHAFDLFADYSQIYLIDAESQGDFSDSWDKQTVENMLAVVPGGIAVSTVRTSTVPVTIEIHAQEPEPNCDAWDHIADCSIDVPAEEIVIMGCTDFPPDAPRINMAPGTYRARIYYANLDKISEDGLKGDDYYKIILWLGEKIEPVVLKKWKNRDAIKATRVTRDIGEQC
ncbi:MAG: hypothetical protein HY868_23510 [Chloroflexi bacterium]|nr:hypothetical protein [Chloroflexota bacterium]